MRQANTLKLMVVLSIVLLSTLPVARLTFCQNDNADSVRPFTINLSDDVLDELKQQPEKPRFPEEISDASGGCGTNLAYLREPISYWRDSFKWRALERRLNQFAQYKTRLNGLDPYFIHKRSSESDAFPIVLLHSWLGSFVEFSHVIGLLAVSALFPAAYAEPSDSDVGGVEIVAADRGRALPGVTITVFSNKEPVAEEKTNRTAMALFSLQEGEYDVEMSSNEKTLRDTIVVKPGEFTSFTADCAESSLEENDEPILNYRPIDSADTESDYRVHMAELDGLISVRMGTPRGTVYVSIPFYAIPGEKVSWSAKALPSETTQEDLKKNERRLRDHELVIGGGYFPLTEDPAATIVAAPTLEINLTEGRKKREKIKASVPFCSSAPGLIVPDSTVPDSIVTEPGTSETPTIDPGQPIGEFSLSCDGINEATAGWPVRIPGVFDGLAENTQATVNGKSVQVEAETRSGVVISSPNWSTGLSTVQIREGSARAECSFRNVAIILSADKLNLHSGETTTMHLKVQGLEKIKEPRYLALVNRSRSVISMSGGNSQFLTIHPSDVNESGEVNQTRTLTGIRRGSFTIDAMLK